MVQINSEAAAVRQVAEKSLILEIELERVVLTPSGVLVGCWQVLTLLSISRLQLLDQNVCSFGTSCSMSSG